LTYGRRDDLCATLWPECLADTTAKRQGKLALYRQCFELHQMDELNKCHVAHTLGYLLVGFWGKCSFLGKRLFMYCRCLRRFVLSATITSSFPGAKLSGTPKQHTIPPTFDVFALRRVKPHWQAHSLHHGLLQIAFQKQQ
jgi:hypothetical protein